MTMYYIYMYLDKDNVPFYIGKGKDDRYQIIHHISKGGANLLLKNKIKKLGVDNIRIYFLHKDLSEEDAFRWESYWIKYIGRRDKSEGSLCNLTDGGEGSSGYVFSDESKCRISTALKGHIVSKDTREKLSKTSEGNQNWLGRTHSEEAKRKVGVASKGRNVGRKHSEETKLKMSLVVRAGFGYWTGKVRSEETKRKISETMKMRTNICNKGVQ
jgi:hypothetical protein